MTYFEDFYATSAEFPHPTLTSGATPPPLRIPQSFELPKRTRQPTLPTHRSFQARKPLRNIYKSKH